MSAKAEALATPARPIAPFIVAILITLAIGVTAGSLITRAVTSDTDAVAEQAGIASWDQQKLDAMSGRQLAASAEVDGPGIAPWDKGKLDAMSGRQLAASAEVDRPGIAPWDQGKLDAMDGFQASAGGAGSG